MNKSESPCPIDLLHVTSHTGVATTRRHVGVKTRAITSLASRVSSVFNNTSQVLYILFRQCSEYLVENSALRKFQQFIMTLMKMRMNVSMQYLSYIFDVNVSTISRLF